MATLPPEPAAPQAHAPHEYRQIAQSFGADTERYDRTRPAYPDALVQEIVAASPGPRVLDVGCGTGTEARQFEAAGCQVLGIEPDARMADFARRSGVVVEVATIETWESGGRQFDAVIAGTAWHWVDPVAGAAKAAQVLGPGGLLAPFHHVFETPPAVMAAFATAYRQVVPDSPVNVSCQPARPTVDLYAPLFAKIADGIRAAGSFTQPEEWRYHWERYYTRDEWLDQLPTLGSLTQLEPDKLGKVLTGVAAAIDAMGGGFNMPYTTVAITAVRTHIA
jgi:SAM-dependent methyltransferase